MATEKGASGSSTSKSKQILIYAIIGILAVVMLVLTGVFIMIGVNNRQEAGESTPDSGQTENKSNEAKPVDIKTLKAGNLSLQYDANNWEAETDNEAATLTYLGDKEYYVLIAYTTSTEKTTTKEYADLVANSYKEQGLKLSKGPSAQKINGVEWQSMVISNNEAWMTVMLYVKDTDYYLVTMASEDKMDKTPDLLKDIVDSLKVK